MKTAKYHVTIDGKPETLTHAYTSGNGIQYNTEGNKEGHTFNTSLASLPMNKPFKTNGHTYVIISKL